MLDFPLNSIYYLVSKHTTYTFSPMYEYGMTPWFRPRNPCMGQSVPILVWSENSIFEEAPLYTFRMREMATTTNMDDC